MANIILSHAYGTDATSVWYPDFSDQLASYGHAVDVPALSETPEPGSWQTAFAARALATPAPQTVLVGHSIGAVNVLRFLEGHDPGRDGVFAGALLVAAPAHEVGYDALAGFFAEPFDWAGIGRAADRFHVLAAADDPVLTPDPLEHAATLVRGLAATATILPAGGHFGASPDDRVEVPDAVRLVLEILEMPDSAKPEL